MRRCLFAVLLFASSSFAAFANPTMQVAAPSQVRFWEIQDMEVKEMQKPVDERNFQQIVDAYFALFEETRHSSAAYKLAGFAKQQQKTEAYMAWLEAAATEGMPKAQLEFGEALIVSAKTCKTGMKWVKIAAEHWDVAATRHAELKAEKPCQKSPARR